MGTERGIGATAVTREVTLSSAVYDVDTVKKAAYRFIDRATADIFLRSGDIVCVFTFTRPISDASADSFIQDFRAELLDQDLRKTIAEETRPLRNAILALAFAATKPPERE
jgi:His-Xaa-Ser system protein HxsD